MSDRKKTDQELHDELEFLLQQRRDGAITSNADLMRLIDMAFKDYLDFNPKEKEDYYEGRKPPGEDADE